MIRGRRRGSVKSWIYEEVIDCNVKEKSMFKIYEKEEAA